MNLQASSNSSAKSMEIDVPFISIVILNHNGRRFLEENLSSVFQSNYQNFEVVFIDNGSSDGSVRLVESRFGHICNLRVVTNAGNMGVAEGRNVGIRHAKGDFIVFLDNDTKVDPEWLKELIGVFEKDPSIGAAQCKILRAENPKKIDSTGGILDCFASPSQRGLMQEDMGQYNMIDEVFYAGGAFMFRRDVLDKVGVFDSNYFLWFEETDLCWRTWLAGYRVVYVPKSVVYHYGSGTTFRFLPSESMQHWIVNQTATQLKNYSLYNLMRFTFPHMIMRLAGNIFFLKGSSYSRLVVKSVLLNIKNCRKILRKRITVQRYVRKTGDEFVMQRMVRRTWKEILLARKLGKKEIKNPCERTYINLLKPS